MLSFLKFCTLKGRTGQGWTIDDGQSEESMDPNVLLDILNIQIEV